MIELVIKEGMRENSIAVIALVLLTFDSFHVLKTERKAFMLILSLGNM
jgi:hypothetical protein